MDNSSIDELFSASKWTLDQDKQLFSLLESFSKSTISQSNKVFESLNQLEKRLESTERETNDAFNQLVSLRNTQFIDAPVVEVPHVPKKEAKTTRQANKVQKETVDRLLPLHGEDVDPLNERPLPFIIGSDEFYNDPNVGLDNGIMEIVEGNIDRTESPMAIEDTDSLPINTNEAAEAHAKEVFGHGFFDQTVASPMVSAFPPSAPTPASIDQSDTSLLAKSSIPAISNPFLTTSFALTESIPSSQPQKGTPLSVPFADDDDLFTVPVPAISQVNPTPFQPDIAKVDPVPAQPILQPSLPVIGTEPTHSPTAPPPPPKRTTKNLLFDDIVQIQSTEVSSNMDDDLFGDNVAPFSDVIRPPPPPVPSLPESPINIIRSISLHVANDEAAKVQQPLSSLVIPPKEVTLFQPKKGGLFDDEEEDDDDGLIY